jgi:hypothetical protein
MLNTTLSTAAVNAEADALAALLNAGFIDLYDGEQPEDADTAISTQNRLVRLMFSAPAFAKAKGGVLTANAIVQGIAQVGSRATWFRASQKDGTPVFDGSVGDADANMVLPTTFIVAKQTVTCTRFTHKIAKTRA